MLLLCSKRLSSSLTHTIPSTPQSLDPVQDLVSLGLQKQDAPGTQDVLKSNNMRVHLLPGSQGRLGVQKSNDNGLGTGVGETVDVGVGVCRVGLEHDVSVALTGTYSPVLSVEQDAQTAD